MTLDSTPPGESLVSSGLFDWIEAKPDPAPWPAERTCRPGLARTILATITTNRDMKKMMFCVWRVLLL